LEQSSPLAGVSVRTRLTVAVALLTGLALAAAGLLVYTLESAHLDSAVHSKIEQEVAEFEQLQGGNDPETAEAFGSVESLIDLFLRRNVPDDSEVLVGYWNGAARMSSPGSPHPGLLRTPAFLEVVDRRIESGGSERIESAHGEVIVTVSPVRSSTTTGALVVVNFMAEERAELVRVMQTYAIISALMLGLITAAAAWQAGRLLSPLRTLRDTAQEITETDLSRRIPEQGNDDITALTRTFNEMLSRLASAFTAQRRFLDDAGHELKTPLTVLRGHLELVDTTSSSEVKATRDLVLDEVDRMSRLVEDLILLAKADRPDFIRAKLVNPAALLDTVLEKCRALGHRTWLVDEATDAVVELDEQRITQALLELAQNAVKHTEEGDEIALGCRMAPPHTLELWVRDTGHGIDPADRERIFDRFARGAVRADDEGFGLGLSIVAAIVHAHGGTVHTEDGTGRGARFTISIPVGGQEDPWPGS
jgi:signal transduction histidine kinase